MLPEIASRARHARITCLLLLSSMVIFGQEDPADTLTAMDRLNRFNSKMEKVIKYSPLPVISYSTETSWMFGLTKYNGFRIGSEDNLDESIQPSQVTSIAYFTLNHQYKIGAEVDLMLNRNKYRWHSEAYYLDFPGFFYGIGNNTLFSDEKFLNLNNLLFSTGLEYKLNNSMYVGAYYSFNHYFNVSYADSSEAEIGNPLAGNEGLQSGLGINFALETRDNRFNASKGHYFFVQYMNFGKWLGSSFSYDLFIMDFRKYFTPVSFLTIAMQVYTEARFGDVPIQSLALMGGDNRMRGIYLGRYRDHTLIDSQVELRFPLAWIFGGTIFTGFGQVAPDYQSYSFKEVHMVAGVGFRIMVDSANKTNLRFDIGISRDQQFIYRQLYFFTFSEAF